jgi:ligand-binding SRPBCC domain-containing protein
MIHYLHREQTIPAPLEEVWDYFCDPRNLNELTPPDMSFEIVHGGDVRMYEGQIIEYRVEFLRGVRALWLTEISHVRKGVYFVDEQRVGPYRLWYHEHIFEVSSSGTKMTDHVTYLIPFGILGELLNAVWISKRLDHIFNFRREKISEIFGGKE